MTGTDCLFCRIVAGDVPSETVHETETTVAFKDINPAAPLHVLVVPRRHIDDASAVTPEDGPVLADMLVSARAVAEAAGVGRAGPGLPPHLQHRARRHELGPAPPSPRPGGRTTEGTLCRTHDCLMTTTLRAECFVPGNHLMAGLLGTRDEHLRQIEQAFPDDQIVVQGDRISVEGPAAELVVRLFEELILMVQAGRDLDSSTVARAIDMVREDIRPSDVLRSEVVRAAGGKTVRPNTAGQKRYVDAISQNIITFGIGPAGTGKSYLAVAQAVHALQSRQVTRIILTRPAVEAGERLGFLPGDLMAKVDPYLRPLYDALYDLLEPEGAQRLLDRGTIEVAPLAFMRGRTLNSSFIILDEAQNTTPEQMKMFLTRIGFGSKCVVTGDVTQIDVPGGRSGLVGLEPVLGGIDDIAFVHLTRRDVVRHKIVADIVDAYEVAEGRAGTTQ